MAVLESLLLLIIVAFFFYLLVAAHEAGHFIVAKLCGAKPLLVVRDGFFIPTAVKWHGDLQFSPWKMLLVTLGGFAAQALATLPLLIQPISEPIRVIFLIYIPVVMLNLLPVFPADGYFVVSLSSHLTGSLRCPLLKQMFRVFLWGIFLFSLLISVTALVTAFKLLLATFSISWLVVVLVGSTLVVRVMLRVKQLLNRVQPEAVG